MSEPILSTSKTSFFPNINVLMGAWLINFLLFWGSLAYFKVDPNIWILMIDLIFITAGGILLTKPSFLKYAGYPNLIFQGIFSAIYLIGFLLTILLFYHLGYIAA